MNAIFAQTENEFGVMNLEVGENNYFCHSASFTPFHLGLSPECPLGELGSMENGKFKARMKNQLHQESGVCGFLKPSTFPPRKFQGWFQVEPHYSSYTAHTVLCVSENWFHHWNQNETGPH